MAKQILLVDDSVTIHRVVTLTFANEDYQVTAVKTGDDGLAKARDLKPDIVLADAGMNGKNGYDVCAALRADGSTTPILILTGNFAPYDEAKGSKAGADGFVVKPFETQALIDKVADAINKKSARPAAAASAPAVAPPPVVTAPPSAPTPAPATTPAPPRAVDIEAPPPPRPAPYQSKPAIPAPTPLPTPPAPPPAVRPPTAPPTARTMMGMQAPVIPPPTAHVAPPKPMQVEPLSKPLSVVAQESSAPRAPAPAPPAPMPPTPAPPAPNVSPASSAASAPSSLPREKVPQMPRPSLIPSVPTPSSAAAVPPPPTGNKPPPPRSTLMGIPTVNPGNLPPGAVALPPSLVKPSAPWGPPAPVAAPVAAPPAPSQAHAAHSPMVAAVTERAVGELAARGPEYEAVAKMSREIIERIAWEVVPELAEVIIREHLDRLVAERQK